MRKDLEDIIFRKKMKQVRQPKNDVDAVIRYMLHNDVKLTGSQDALCTRLMFVDSLNRGRKHTTDEIIELLKEKFTITQYRAQQDLYDCQKVFGETRKLNKTYLLSHHIQDIGITIQKCLDAKKFDLLAKLYDNYTYAINSLPVETEMKESPPTQITYVFNGAPPVDQQPIEDVLATADKLLTPGKHGEYINYEESLEPEPSTDDGSDDPGE
jgi:hypothetical protein